MQRDPSAICQGLQGYVSFLNAFGDSNSNILRLREFIRRLEEEKISKALLEELINFRDGIHGQVTMQILANRCLPGKDKDQTEQEYYRVLNVLGAAIHPQKPQPPEMNIGKFAGVKHVKRKRTAYAGDPDGVGPIVEHSVDLIQRYSEAVGRGDFEAAYRLTGAGLRDWMTFKRFVSTHEKAAREYGGAALEFQIDEFLFVLADAAARKKSTADEGWPKATPKDVRRSRLVGFWIRKKSLQTGCWGAFWITEENNDYRVAKFDFFTQ
jgi:hypothetical protein